MGNTATTQSQNRKDFNVQTVSAGGAAAVYTNGRATVTAAMRSKAFFTLVRLFIVLSSACLVLCFSRFNG